MPEALRKAILANVRSLPVMSTAATKVLTLLRDPNADAARFESAIRYDPSLTGNILKMSNSAYFGCRGKIGSIREAVVLLGWKRVYQLVVASSVHAAMEKTVAGYELPKGELWRHSVAVAVACESLMRRTGLPVPEECFTAALLHDVGKLVVGDLLVPHLGQIIEMVTRGMPFETAEREVLGIDHAEAGARVLESWSFPPSLAHAVRWHHEPDTTSTPSVGTDLVHVADVLCLMLGTGQSRGGLQYKPSEASLERLGLQPEHLNATANAILDDVDDVIQALKPDAPQAAAVAAN